MKALRKKIPKTVIIRPYLKGAENRASFSIMHRLDRLETELQNQRLQLDEQRSLFSKELSTLKNTEYELRSTLQSQLKNQRLEFDEQRSLFMKDLFTQKISPEDKFKKQGDLLEPFYLQILSIRATELEKLSPYFDREARSQRNELVHGGSSKWIYRRWII